MLKKSLNDGRYIKRLFTIHGLQDIENIFCKLDLLSKKGFIVERVIWMGAGERIGGGDGTDWEGDWL